MGKEVNIKSDTIIKRDENQIFSEIDNEIVMLNINNAEYYNLNKVGAEIWNLLSKPITFSVLIEKLLVKFEVDKEQCENETKEYLNILFEKDLINVCV